MEKIIRIDGILYYGNRKCDTPDAAYKLYKKDYEETIGRDSTKRLNRLGQRTDILHWSGFVLSDEYHNSLQDYRYDRAGKVYASIVGIVCTSYCKILGWNDVLNVPEDEWDGYLDWLMERGNKYLGLKHRKSGLGRTNKRKHIKFR